MTYTQKTQDENSNILMLLTILALFFVNTSLVLAQDNIPPSPDQTSKCLEKLKNKANAGNGEVAKKLSIYFGNEKSSHYDPELSLQFIKVAISKGVNLSDMSYGNEIGILKMCQSDDKAKRPTKSAKVDAGYKDRSKSAEPTHSAIQNPANSNWYVPNSQENPQSQASTNTEQESQSSKTSEIAKRQIRSEAYVKNLDVEVIENLKRANQFELTGKTSLAIPYLESARNNGSLDAAKRLYDIYALGSGDVDADYASSIKAARKAKEMGLQVASNLGKK